MAVTRRCDHCSTDLDPSTDATYGVVIRDPQIGEINVYRRGGRDICTDCLTTAVAGSVDVIPLKQKRAG